MQHTAKTQRDLWKICSKIRNVVNRIKFNFWEYYLIYDPKNTGFISKSQFENVLSGPLKTTIDLNYEEIQLLVLRFCESQDHVRYGEFCQMVHESGPNEESQSDNRNNETSKYTEKDIPRLIAMKKIANDLKLRSIELEPYFDDYEQESQENKSTESKSRKYTNKNVFHPVLEHKTNKKDNVITVLRNVQKHVLQNQINIGQFFKPFDPYNKGFVTEDQFRRCLDSIGVSSLHRLYYSEPELALLLLMFKDEEHPENIRWRKFEDEINTGKFHVVANKIIILYTLIINKLIQLIIC
ncbi:uncharacterized protein LOC126838198 [Adelges cooleyi]|uniref:uncharacterized protein LOC126838198 n=1 Tax=Adelges cooleyi TaxID=133065 RepID=UPI00217F8BB6|nr:uncharacterized protein LOC126838198 [Adelges cooleyi]